MGESHWSFAVTDRLRLDAHIEYEHGEIGKFGLNLSGLIDGDWAELVRYDNSHGPSHRHQFHPDGTESNHTFVAALVDSFVDRAQTDLTENAERYLEEYERELANMKGELP